MVGTAEFPSQLQSQSVSKQYTLFSDQEGKHDGRNMKKLIAAIWENYDTPGREEEKEPAPKEAVGRASKTIDDSVKKWAWNPLGHVGDMLVSRKSKMISGIYQKMVFRLTSHIVYNIWHTQGFYRSFLHQTTAWIPSEDYCTVFRILRLTESSELASCRFTYCNCKEGKQMRVWHDIYQFLCFADSEIFRSILISFGMFLPADRKPRTRNAHFWWLGGVGRGGARCDRHVNICTSLMLRYWDLL